ncbi:MAG TPA: tetratricopeptide repeat protein [Candidatus Angelobacter sp.]|nr:tetratricopeptide repeat protein [Candidatus Angelobacter sp.]
MKRIESFAALFVAALVLYAPSAWSQTLTSGMEGKVTRNGEPATGLQFVLSSPANGREYKTKTDKKGQYSVVGVQVGTYIVKIIGPGNEVLYVKETSLNTTPFEHSDIDLAKPEDSGGRAGTPADAQPAPASNKKMSKEEQKAEEARVKAQNEKITVLNGFITQYQTAIKAQNFADAEKALKSILETVPDTTRWEFFRALGDVQSQNNEPADAIKSYEKGIERAQLVASGKAPKDPFNPTADPGAAKSGIGPMMVSEGNAYVKMGKPEMATPLFQQATQDNPNPSLAFYNLCAVEFNANKIDEAIAACDKSIAADPKRAEAWFLKGSALYKAGKPDSGKSVAEAMNKYLQLDPNGQHVSEAKSILQLATQK